MNNTKRGHLKIILGPMFSGKTTELQRTLRIHKAAKRKTLAVHHSKDTRYTEGNEIVTHDKSSIDAISVSSLSEINEGRLDAVSVIGIDEGQFFNDIVAFCETWTNKHKIIVVAALDGTFERKKFGFVLDLIPLSDKVKKQSAICNFCGRKAIFSHRTVPEKNRDFIGGKESYVALCRTCYDCNNQGAASPPAPQDVTIARRTN